MTRAAVLPLLVLAAACSEVAPERAAPADEAVAQVAAAPAPPPETIPRPPAPTDDAEDGIAIRTFSRRT